MYGKCKCCGGLDLEGVDFEKWVKPTFTDFDKLQDGNIVCHSCLFFFDESSGELAKKVGKEKPQRMRNYSHFIVNGEWIPLSKGDKAKMKELLLGDPFPELAAIASSGQKHIVFRAIRNPLGSKHGWVQFEEQKIYIVPQQLKNLISMVEELYSTFSKDEIESGIYSSKRILDFGIERWKDLENKVKSNRGKPIFMLALFLAQRSKDESGNSEHGSGLTNSDLEGDTQGI